MVAKPMESPETNANETSTETASVLNFVEVMSEPGSDNWYAKEYCNNPLALLALGSTSAQKPPSDLEIVFDENDTNGDGKLTAAEIDQGQRSTSQSDRSAKLLPGLKLYLNAKSVGGGTYLDKHDVEVLDMLRPQPFEPLFGNSFYYVAGQFDANHDGVISQTELVDTCGEEAVTKLKQFLVDINIQLQPVKPAA